MLLGHELSCDISICEMQQPTVIRIRKTGSKAIQKSRKKEQKTHLCIALEPVFTRNSGDRLQFTIPIGMLLCLCRCMHTLKNMIFRNSVAGTQAEVKSRTDSLLEYYIGAFDTGPYDRLHDQRN